MKTLACIGAGRVARAVAWAASRHGYTLVSAWSPSGTSARRLCHESGGRPATSAGAAAVAADLILLAVPDSQIAPVAAALAAVGATRAGQVALHCSGALAAGSLAPLAAAGTAVGSWHPLQSLTGASRQAAALLRGARVALEGDDAAVAAGRDLAAAVGAEPLPVASAAKPLYHAAAVFAANYLVAVAAAARRAWVAAGLDPSEALPSLLPMMKGALSHLEQQGLPAALTGPISRGDAGTVALHLAALGRQAPDLIPLYAALGQEALRLAPSSPAIATLLQTAAARSGRCEP